MQEHKVSAAGLSALGERAPSGDGEGVSFLLSVTALLLAGVATGRSYLSHLCHSPDLEAAGRALSAMGAHVEWAGSAVFVCGPGNGALLAPQIPLDFAGAPMALALTSGLVAPYDMSVSLGPGMPPETILEPLRQMGTQVEAQPAGGVRLSGPPVASPLRLALAPPSSPLLKASLLLAGLNTPGVTALVDEGAADGEELARLKNLFLAFGVRLSVQQTQGGGRHIRLTGRSRLSACALDLAAMP